MSFKTWTAGEQLLAADLNENFLKTPSVTAVASGTLADGSKVVLNSDGTVSVISGMSPDNGAQYSPSFAGSSNGQRGCYDPASSTVVIVGQENAQASGGGVCTVGTVSGTVITFGTKATFLASWTADANVVPIGSSKVAIIYCDYNNSQRGGMIIGTISGTTISFGSAATFNASASVNGSINFDWDSTSSKGLLTYKNTTTELLASVVTVSGTTITINTAVQLYSGSASLTRTKWTGTANVFAIAYQDVTGSLGRACVATVSGTTVSFGTKVSYYAGAISEHDVAWDTTNSCFVIAYKQTADTKGYVIVGTISGTNISFGTVVNFCATATSGINVCHDATNNKTLLVYFDATNTKGLAATVSGTTITLGTSYTVYSGNAGLQNGCLYHIPSTNYNYLANGSSNVRAMIFKTSFTNLTSTNFLGICQGAYTNGQTARIGVVGCKDANQSGLTAGLKYYVNDDGTLGTTTTQPYFGLALSATSILIKG